MATKLHGVFADNMMLQAGKPVEVRGTTRAGQAIKVTLAGQSWTGKADKSGAFSVPIGPLSYGGPHTLQVNEKKIKNVLVGDIWFCSGQSNMDFEVANALNPDAEATAARYPKIRLLRIPRSLSSKPETEMPSGVAWREAAPDTIPGFSAVAYYFGREVHRATDHPIGLIHCAWGGTRIEPWVSMTGFSSWRQFPAEKQKYAKKFQLAARLGRREPAQRVVEDPNAEQIHADTGNAGLAMGLAKADLDDRKFKSLQLPGWWTDKGLNFVGALWFRRTIDVPDAWLGNDLYLSLGAITDFDDTYFNGKKIGFTGKETPDFWAAPRKYVVPAALVRPGRNVIAVRMFAHKTHGGSCGRADEVYLSVINKPRFQPLMLGGSWKYEVERKLPRLGMVPAAGTGSKVDPVLDSTTPTWIYNSMVAPLQRFAIKGALWYQGESNAQEDQAYAELQPLLVRDWRRGWNCGEIPFYFVQLAGYGPGLNWPEFRIAQESTVRDVPHTGMATAIDVGDESDIHPRNKQEVGRRLALQALVNEYGRRVECFGPAPTRAERRGKKIIVHFAHAEGLHARGFGGMVVGFEVGAARGGFQPVCGKLVGKTVVLNPGGSSIATVRYAWLPFPDCNLYNKAGLPATPFVMKVS